MRRWLVAGVTFAFVAAACTAGGGGDDTPETVDPSASNEPVTLSIWGGWTGREYKDWIKIFEGFEAQYPWITVEPKGGIDDPKIVSSISAGNPPDAVLSFGVDNVGKFCESGAWIDMNPYIDDPDVGFDRSIFPGAALTYTSYNGIQCSLPFMTDVTGLYYNLDLFEKAGLSAPPETTDELVEYAKQLTEFNADGSIKVAGFVPWIGYYCCGSTTLNFGHMFGAQWMDDQGQVEFASDAAWAEMFQWQKDFVAEVYGGGDFQTGSDALQRFVAGAGEEFSSANDFERGRTAMAIDGEWRNAFISDEVPDLNYGAAPLPIAPGNEDLYGSGVAGGTVIGIPRGSEHEAEAWLLIKYMATDTATLVYMTNQINNVPTTNEALSSSELDVPEQFQVFLDGFEHQSSAYRPTTPIGDGLATYLDQFAEKWQAGKATDLQAGLQEVADNTNTDLEQAQI